MAEADSIGLTGAVQTSQYSNMAEWIEQTETVKKDDEAAAASLAPAHYANKVQISASMQDLRITFGRTTPAGPAGYDIAVYMSLVTAKQMQNLLAEMISGYEKNFGEVPVEPRRQK